MSASPENVAVWNRLGLIATNGVVTISQEVFYQALDLARPDHPIPAYDGEALERLAEAANNPGNVGGIRNYKVPVGVADLRTALALIATQAERIGELEAAIEPIASLASDEANGTSGVNMSDPISKWFTVANIHRAAALLTKGQSHG